MNYSEMRDHVENYMLNVRERDRILMDYEDPSHAVRKRVVINEHVSMNKSVTEREAIRNVSREKKVASITKKINYVDLNMRFLSDDERSIINYIKYGDKLSSISRATGIERRKVARLRDNAIEKMVATFNKRERLNETKKQL